MVLIDSRQKFG